MLEPLKSEVDELQTKLSGVENTKGWLERRLNETEVLTNRHLHHILDGQKNSNKTFMDDSCRKLFVNFHCRKVCNRPRQNLKAN